MIKGFNRKTYFLKNNLIAFQVLDDEFYSTNTINKMLQKSTIPKMDP